MINLDVCFLILWPFQATSKLGPQVSVSAPKDAPYFYDLDIEFRTSWGERQFEVEGTSVRVKLQVLDELVWVAECRYVLEDGLEAEALSRQLAIQGALKQKLWEETDAVDPLNEVYTILLFRGTTLPLDSYVDEQVVPLGHLLRALVKPPGEAAAAEIFNARARYSKRDLTVVDWSGALVFAENSDFQADIDLLKIGKYQLLRYRMLDQTVQQMLEQVRQNVANVRLRWLPTRNKTMHTIVQQRLSLLLDFEKIDQSLLLIGDWYSAQVYELIVERYALDDWKDLVSRKLENLATIDAVVRENLTFSWSRFFDLIMLIGWLILLVGYFFLFFAG